MKRRTFIQGVGASVAAAGLAAPALAQSARSRTLIYTPTAGLLILDPHFTTINQTAYYGHSVFETLYAIDSSYRAQPMMVAGHTISDDRLTWVLTLRDGLMFHDGEPVRAQDCIASINRWSQRDGFGATMMKYTDELSAVDDKTIRFRLNRPFGILPDALAHPMASPCVIMPERMASLPITEQVTESIGSGPVRFLRDEFVPGQRAVFVPHEGYVPRSETPDGMSGAKIVHFDRIEWHTLPDHATAAAALQAGEIDWLDTVHQDLVPLLQFDPSIVVTPSDAAFRNYLRFNSGVGTFANPELRRLVASAMDERTFSMALLGPNDNEPCYAMYPCGLPGVNQQGAALMGGEKDYEAIAAKVRAAGYNGEKVALIAANDVTTTVPMNPIIVDVMQKIGFNVELQSMDLNTMVTRRISQETVENGGWSMMTLLASTPVQASPLSAVMFRGLGTSGYPGNYEDAELESRIGEWIASDTPEDRETALDQIQGRLWDQMPTVPLTTYSQFTAFRSDLTGYLQNTAAVPWNIRRQ